MMLKEIPGEHSKLKIQNTR